MKREEYRYASEKLDPRLLNKNQLYLRIGSNFEASKFGLGKEWEEETGKRWERGTSAYFLDPFQNGYAIKAPSQDRALYGLKNYFTNMFTHVLVRSMSIGDIYIITGDLFVIQDYPEIDPRFYDYNDEDEEGMNTYWTYETGSDGEPLLQPDSIKIYKRVELGEFLSTFYLNTNFTVGQLLEPGWGRGRRTLQDIYNANEFGIEFGGEEYEEEEESV